MYIYRVIHVSLQSKRDRNIQSSVGVDKVAPDLPDSNLHSTGIIKGPCPGKWHVFVLALLYVSACLNE